MVTLKDLEDPEVMVDFLKAFDKPKEECSFMDMAKWIAWKMINRPLPGLKEELDKMK